MHNKATLYQSLKPPPTPVGINMSEPGVGGMTPADLGSSYVLVYVTKHVQEVMSKRGVLGHVVL
jgi:hypothetical protein